MKRWSMIAIIGFILIFVFSIVTSKTEIVQMDHSSGVSVTITHEKKLFFIHSFQLAVYNGTGQTIEVEQPVSTFTLVPGGSFPTANNDVLVMEEVAAGSEIVGHREKFWRLANAFHLTAVIRYELNGELQAIEISQALGEVK